MDNATANKIALESFNKDETHEIYDNTIFFTDTKTLLLLGDDVILIYDKDTQRYYATRFTMDANTKKQAKKTMQRYKTKGFVQNRLPSYIALAGLLIVVACYIVNTSNEKARLNKIREQKNQEIQKNRPSQDTIDDYQTYRGLVQNGINQNIPQQKTL